MSNCAICKDSKYNIKVSDPPAKEDFTEKGIGITNITISDLYSVLYTPTRTNSKTAKYPTGGFGTLSDLSVTSYLPTEIVNTTLNIKSTDPIVVKYNSDLSLFSKNLVDEFCLRYACFEAGLKILLNKIIEAKTNTTITAAVIQQNISDVTELNRRCQNVLKAMENTIRELNRRTTTFNTTALELSKVIDDNKSKILSYNSILSSGDLESDVHKRMTEYTYEKNKNTTNLLALYGGLNIVALAMLVYIYRS